MVGNHCSWCLPRGSTSRRAKRRLLRRRTCRQIQCALGRLRHGPFLPDGCAGPDGRQSTSKLGHRSLAPRMRSRRSPAWLSSDHNRIRLAAPKTQRDDQHRAMADRLVGQGTVGLGFGFEGVGRCSPACQCLARSQSGQLTLPCTGELVPNSAAPSARALARCILQTLLRDNALALRFIFMGLSAGPSPSTCGTCSAQSRAGAPKEAPAWAIGSGKESSRQQ